MDDCAILAVNGHYELWVNGSFYCSADTYEEAYKEYKEMLVLAYLNDLERRSV